MVKRKPRRRAVLKWGETQYMPHGSRFWDTLDGGFRIVASEVYDGIPLPRLYVVWVWDYSEGGRGLWTKIAETTSIKRAKLTCEERHALDKK